MKKLLGLSLLMIAFFVSYPSLSFAEGENLDIRILKAKKIFTDFNSDESLAIPPEILARSQAIIIFPTFVKAGFLYAGRYGAGVAMARDEATGTWSPPVFVRVSGGGFGLQVGIIWTDLILVGRDKFTFEKYGDGGPTVSGSATATFGVWGVHSELGSGWQLNSAMHWFSKSRGLFAALATDGTIFSFDEEANRFYYGDGANSQEIFFGNTVKAKATGQMLLDAIAEYEREALSGTEPYITTASH